MGHAHWLWIGSLTLTKTLLEKKKKRLRINDLLVVPDSNTRFICRAVYTFRRLSRDRMSVWSMIWPLMAGEGKGAIRKGGCLHTQKRKG